MFINVYLIVYFRLFIYIKPERLIPYQIVGPLDKVNALLAHFKAVKSDLLGMFTFPLFRL